MCIRDRAAEGFVLKRADAPYTRGRRRGVWWKWKVDPLTVDAVLVYAQAGHGRRSNLYTDYTLAVWGGAALVPVAKACSGLTDAELSEMDPRFPAGTPSSASARCAACDRNRFSGSPSRISRPAAATRRDWRCDSRAVSYTHLTLPTIYPV